MSDPKQQSPLSDKEIEKSREQDQNVDSDGRERQPTQHDPAQKNQPAPADLNRGTRSEE